MYKQTCSLFNDTYTSVSQWCSSSCIPSAEPAQCSPVSCPRSRNRYHRVLHCRVQTKEVRLQHQINEYNDTSPILHHIARHHTIPLITTTPKTWHDMTWCVMSWGMSILLRNIICGWYLYDVKLNEQPSKKRKQHLNMEDLLEEWRTK